MIEQRTIFEIHRLADVGESARKIAEQVGHDRATVQKYMNNPTPERPSCKRPSKLEPFRDEIARLLETDQQAPATVIL